MSLLRTISDIFWGEWGSTKRIWDWPAAKGRCPFQAGDSVVCISQQGNWVNEWGAPRRGPRLNEICVVKSVDRFDGYDGIFIETTAYPNFAIPHGYFRPLRKTDISALRALLNPAPADVEHLREDA